jgi:hypothetical protein
MDRLEDLDKERALGHTTLQKEMSERARHVARVLRDVGVELALDEVHHRLRVDGARQRERQPANGGDDGARLRGPHAAVLTEDLRAIGAHHQEPLEEPGHVLVHREPMQRPPPDQHVVEVGQAEGLERRLRVVLDPARKRLPLKLDVDHLQITRGHVGDRARRKGEAELRLKAQRGAHRRDRPAAAGRGVHLVQAAAVPERVANGHQLRPPPRGVPVPTQGRGVDHTAVKVDGTVPALCARAHEHEQATS